MDTVVPILSLLAGLAAGGACVWFALHRSVTHASEAFRALAADALEKQSGTFLHLANESLTRRHELAKSDLDRTGQAISTLLGSAREAIENVDARVEELERSRVGAYTGLSLQVSSLVESQEELRAETAKLVNALRSPTVRGRWGEVQMRRVVELAGMSEHCDFIEQAGAPAHARMDAEGNEEASASAGRRRRPDLVVRLPGAGSVVIDAKTPLESYLKALDAPDEETRTRQLRAHARGVRAHVRSLSRKAYFRQFDPAPEFVVLFLPGEAFFSAALEHDRELLEFAATRNVVLASPTTLIALLRAVAAGWRQDRLTKNAAEISRLGRVLYGRLALLGKHFECMGRSLASATDSYNRAVGSLESRVLPAARRFEDLGAGASEVEIAELRPVDRTPRRVMTGES